MLQSFGSEEIALLICLGSVSRKTQEAKQGVTFACSFSLMYFPSTLLPLWLFTLLEFS